MSHYMTFRIIAISHLFHFFHSFLLQIVTNREIYQKPHIARGLIILLLLESFLFFSFLHRSNVEQVIINKSCYEKQKTQFEIFKQFYHKNAIE